MNDLQVAIVRLTLLLVAGLLGVLSWAGFRFYVTHPFGLRNDLRSGPLRALLGLFTATINILLLGASWYLIAVALAAP